LFDFALILESVPFLARGAVYTVEVSVLAIVFGLVLGWILGLAAVSGVGWLRAITWAYVQFIRGTPLLIQLYFLFYVLPTWGLTVSALATGIIGLGLFFSAYATEIYRAGIEDLPAGQWEAALALGLPIRRVWTGIILPQAIRAVLPMLGNIVVSMFKQTALLSTITVLELLAHGMAIGQMTYRFVEPLTLVGAFYFAVSYLSARALRSLETRDEVRA